MQTTAWRVHTPIQRQVCLTCGLTIPDGAIAEGKAYQNGGIWSSAPKGNALPCHSEK